jgi:methionine synthase II (cobalamin-independent)
MTVLAPLTAFHVGSLPHTDPERACQLAFDRFPSVLAWPQLPRRAHAENMYVQFSERFPGIVLEGDRIYVDRTRDLDPGLEALYTASIDDDLSYGELSPEYACGLYTFLDQAGQQPAPQFVKGQVTGPVSWGLSVLDQDRRPILYDEILADAIALHLQLKARWQEQMLGQIHDRVIISVDEPYMASFGSAYVALSRAQAVDLMERVLGAIDGLTMVHCCGNTDWSILLATSVDVLSFDAYAYAANLALYPGEVSAFLDRGGILAWGITPKSEDAYSETVPSLTERLLHGMQLLVQKGILLDDVLQASAITPSCGLGSLSEPLAERVMELTAGVAQAMQERYA